MQQFSPRTQKRTSKHLLVSMLIFGTTISAILVQDAYSNAANHNLSRPSFDFDCQVTEPEFYEWVETNLWRKNRPFHRSLANAIDALVSSPNWTIHLPQIPCENLGMPLSRRESLLFMIDDARSEGAGSLD